MGWITSQTFSESSSPLCIDDVAYLPTPGSSHTLESMATYFDLYNNSDFEEFVIVPSVSLAGIGYIIKEGGFTEKVFQTFSLQRLHNIRQLGFLQRPLFSQKGTEITTYPMSFSQSRYQHVLDVQAILILMLKNNGITGSDFYIARLAALLHDTLTPAGGDTTKLIDYEAFNEDLHFPELLKKVEWSSLCQEFGIDPALLIDTVQGKGVLGRLLDIADKIAYTGRDYINLIGLLPHTPAKHSPFYALTRLTKKNPIIGSLWETVLVEGEDVIFTNSKQLVNFLTLRALMFRNLYYNPVARFREFLIGRVIMQYLYKGGALTRDALLTMEDWELESVLSQFLGVGHGGFNVFGGYTVHVECFATKREGHMKEADLHQENTTFTFLEEVSCRTKSGVHYLVKTDGGALPLSQAHPKETRKIESFMKLEKPVRLYWIENANFSPNLLSALEAYKVDKK